jgi:hypothetical protein
MAANHHPDWVVQNGLIAYPHGWQQPARTEEWAYEQCSQRLPRSDLVQLVCFPWATLIDLLKKGHQQRAMHYIEAIDRAPPKKNLVRATVCQHIEAMSALPWFKAMKITDLFWSHARKGQYVVDGIRIHPFPLYPVRCHDQERAVVSAWSKRPYLYSFIGAYQERLYLTPVREWLFQLPTRDDALTIRRGEWHYEKEVYVEQINKGQRSDAERAKELSEANQYVETLSQTRFSLCPSGSGPNSIRLWESLCFGTIPVLLSDQLQLPGREDEWRSAVIQTAETSEAVAALPQLLEKLDRDRDRIEAMLEAGRRLWTLYGVNGPLTLLEPLSRIRHIYQLHAGGNCIAE